ncbi:MAG: hypothetical protein KF845_06045 [Cyclobacteriaceae bacterium]|nr:hypothetical protein [Cyclobacteriaceae bacterium]
MSVKKAVIIVILLECLVAAFAFYNYGQSLEALQAVTRYSGRVSLLVFSTIFLLLPQHEGTLERLLSPRPFLVFVIAHGIHLAELLSFVYLSGNELIPVRLAGGFVAYIFIFAMPVVKQYTLTGKLSIQRYRVIQTVYLYYVWFIFFMTYLPRVQGKLAGAGGQYWEFVILLAWVCMMLGMKLQTFIRFSR